MSVLVEITKVEISAEKVIIEGNNLESVIYGEDLFEDFDCTPVTFEFDRKARNGAALKYLYKVCRSQKKNKDAKSMGEMLKNLCGVITQLSENFKVAQDVA